MTAIAAQTAEIWLSITEASENLGVPRSTAYGNVAENRWIWREGKRGKEVLLASLPLQLQERAQELTSAVHIEHSVEALPQSRDKALLDAEAARRFGVLETYYRLPKKQRTDERFEEMATELAQVPAELADCEDLTARKHPQSYYRIYQRAKKQGAQFTLGRHGPRRKGYGSTLTDEGKRYLNWLWPEQCSWSYQVAYTTYRKEAKRRGWPSSSYPTVYRYLRSLDTDVVNLKGKGERKFNNENAPYVDIDFSNHAAGEYLNGDHHQFDVFVRDEQTGRVFRPWLTGWQCMRSKAMWGYALCKSPNSQSIMEALLQGIQPKHRPEYERMCGVPSKVHIDNGKDYRSRAVEGEELPESWRDSDQVYAQGILTKLHIKVSHALPYHPRSKPIERFFGTLCQQFSKAMGEKMYSGNSPKTRPDQVREARKEHDRFLKGEIAESPFMTLEELERYFEAWLYTYHCTPHRSLSKGGQRLSPLDVIRLHGRAPRIVKDSTLELMVMPPEKRTVQKGGRVRARNLHYFNERLISREGESVLVSIPQTELGRVYIYSARQDFICEGVSARGMRLDEEAVGEAAIKDSKRYRKDLRERRREFDAGVPDDALTPREALLVDVPEPSAEPHQPADAVRHIVPNHDRVELRQEEAPAEPPSELVIVPQPATVAPRRKLHLMEADREFDLDTYQRAVGDGRGEDT